MGDMTDYYLSSCDYGWGDQDDDPYDGGWCPKERKVIKCNKCGSTDVTWKQIPSGKWCLHTNGQPHVCVKKETVVKAISCSGKNSSRKEYTGYKLVSVKICSTCDSFDEDDAHCDKYDYSVVWNGICATGWSAIATKKAPVRKEYRVTSYTRPQPRPKEQSIQDQWNNAKICPHCGDRAGFSFGTGDCGCESSPDVGW